MCGWIGVFGTPTDATTITAATDLLESRGPDGFGIRLLGSDGTSGAVGHRRLAILDPSSAGAQPMHDPESRCTVVYNGEIYNSPELRSELRSKGIRFFSGTDTEVLLRGWVEWGDEVLQRIEGIFSFALINEATGRVLMARDRLGVKPLYWARYGDGVVAGSAPRALIRCAPQLGSSLDRVALAQFLTLLWIPHPRTPWEAIHKLEPGGALSLASGQLRSWRYWSPPEATDSPLDSDALLGRLAQATNRQLLSDVPVGLLLSGGLDSSLLLELMHAQLDGPGIEALTAGFDSSSQRLEITPDDARYARLAASRHPNAHLREVSLGANTYSDVDTLAFHFDDPVADPAAISLYQLVRASNSKVLLSGVGGEELFAGYPRHLRLDIAVKAAGLPLAARRAVAALARHLAGGRPGPMYAARRNAQKLARSISGTTDPHYWQLASHLTFDEANRLSRGAAKAAFEELDAMTVPLRSATLRDALDFDRSQFLPNLNLAYVDKASMAAGIEVRVPLLDELVVAHTYAADSRTFIVNGITKAPLKAAGRGLVLDAIIDRPKSGFGGPVRAWFRSSTGSSLLGRIDAVADAGLVDRSVARTIFANAANGAQDAGLAAWAIVCLQSWYQAHGQRPPAGPTYSL